MELKEFWIYLLIMAGSTYLIRTIPFAAISGKIENKFIKSFLYYIPYAVLTAMTFPAVLYATDYMVSAAVGLVVAVLFALKGKSLTTVAVAACVGVFITETVIKLIF
ncbi:MAG: AzlD domain-containing protein [Lachnospiraceae bacterium]|nr:AzlD domain-containing protein [Lachnospiraceae bacterium]